jgi:hypothetical protein
MPNWCNNRLTVLGPANRVAAFVKKANGPGPRYKAQRWDIVEWEAKCKKAEAEGKPKPPHPDEEEREPMAMSFHQLRPIPPEIEKGDYDPGGYNAEHQLWGCKWGACESKLVSEGNGRADYEFDTPWGPATELFEFISKNEWSDLTFICSWGEEFPSRGRFAVRGGTFIANVCDHSMSNSGPGDPPEGLDDEAQSQWYTDWERYYYDRHEAFVVECTPS